MPIHINEPDSGNFLDVHVSGILSKADYEQFVPEFERLVREHGKLRVLFDMTGFHGWEAGAIFCQPFMKAKVQYFDHTDVAGARKWLAEP